MRGYETLGDVQPGTLTLGVVVTDESGAAQFVNDAARVLLNYDTDDSVLKELLARAALTMPEMPAVLITQTSAALQFVVGPQNEHGGSNIVCWRARKREDVSLEAAELLPSLLHGLRNPVTTIAVGIEMAMAEQPKNEDFQLLFTEVQRLALALDCIGSLSKSPLSARPEQLEQSAKKAFSILAVRAAQYGIKTALHIQPLPPLSLSITMLRGVIFALTMNAIHACKKDDSIALKLWFEPEDHALHLSLQDTGCGMSREKIEECLNAPHGNHRLGIMTCARAARLAGGDMTIDSEQGKGTLVSMYFKPKKSHMNMETKEE